MHVNAVVADGKKCSALQLQMKHSRRCRWLTHLHSHSPQYGFCCGGDSKEVVVVIAVAAVLSHSYQPNTSHRPRGYDVINQFAAVKRRTRVIGTCNEFPLDLSFLLGSSADCLEVIIGG